MPRIGNGFLRSWHSSDTNHNHELRGLRTSLQTTKFVITLDDTKKNYMGHALSDYHERYSRYNKLICAVYVCKYNLRYQADLGI